MNDKIVKLLFRWKDGEPYYITHNNVPQEIPLRIKKLIKQFAEKTGGCHEQTGKTHR